MFFDDDEKSHSFAYIQKTEVLWQIQKQRARIEQKIFDEIISMSEYYLKFCNERAGKFFGRLCGYKTINLPEALAFLKAPSSSKWFYFNFFERISIFYSDESVEDSIKWKYKFKLRKLSSLERLVEKSSKDYIGITTADCDLLYKDSE